MSFHRFPMANGVCSPLLQARVGLLILPALLAVPAIAQTPTPDAPAQNSTVTAPAAVPEGARAGTPDRKPERGEMRGMWVVRDSLSSPASVHRVVVTAVKYHLNALFVQVRGRGDALYNSSFEPRSEVLAGTPASFDPLQQMVAEAHANGIQVHAWLNTFLTWSGSRAPRSPQHLWNAHRDWFTADRHGNTSCIPTNSSEGAFLQPSNPAVQQHLFNVFTEVASKYDVDGIHFDYCRYCGPNYDFRASTLHRFHDFMAETLSPEDVARFDKRLKSDRLAYVHAFGGAWADWRRLQITNLVTRISQAVKAEKPWMEVSAAVFPNAHEAYAVRGQDWEGWLRSGALDAVALMAYDGNTQRVLAETRHAVAIAGEKHVYTGIGAWHLQAHDVAHKIALVRAAGAAGVNLFSYGGVHDRPHYLDTLSRGVFASRAAPPRMRWLPDRAGPVKRTPETPPTAPAQ